MAEKAVEQGFVSKLGDGRERFLAHPIEHGLEIGQRTPEDFIRHFSPAAIMTGLRNQPALRAQILVLTVGVKQKIAIKKSAESAGEDLQIALDEGETDAESIVALFNPDDRVRYLAAPKIWAYATEPEFWKATPAKAPEFERAKAHMAFILERALADKLLTHRDIVEGITVDELATRLPRGELGKLLKKALENSHKKNPFTEVDLLATLPAQEIVKHVPLAHIWESVVIPKIAQKHGYWVAPTAGPAAGTSGAIVVSAPAPGSAMDWLDAEEDKRRSKDSKEPKDSKDHKDGKEPKDLKDGKEPKDLKDGKEPKDLKDGKDLKDQRDSKPGIEDRVVFLPDPKFDTVPPGAIPAPGTPGSVAPVPGAPPNPSLTDPALDDDGGDVVITDDDIRIS